MSTSLPVPDLDEDDDLPLAPPFYPKALVCFVISSLCLTWLISLPKSHAESHSALAPVAAKPISKEIPAAEPEKPAAPPRELSENDYELVEIELIHALVQEDTAMDLKRAANELKPYSLSTNTAVREAALHEIAAVQAAYDKAALQSIADIDTHAHAMAAREDFAGALDLLQRALKALPPDASLSGQGADKKLKELIAEFETKRAAVRDAALGGLEADLQKKDPAADARLEKALAHPDAAVRDEAKAIQRRVADVNDKALAAHRASERNAREEWLRFFKRFGGTIADGDFSGANELIETPPFEAILKGGVSDPEKVLKRCARDISAIQNVYEEALKDAKGLRKQVSFHLRRGGQAAGTLIGTNGRLLRIYPGKGAEIVIKIIVLTSEGVKAILDSGIKYKPDIALALAALEAYENPNDAESIISAAYEKAREPLPLHWAERFKIEKLLVKIQTAEEKLQALKKAVASDNGDEIKAALTDAKAVIATLNELGARGEEDRAMLNNAERTSAKKQLETVTLQNGKSPEPTYRGINTDQITDYRESLRRTDVGVGYGLKLGAAGGLQRVLIKFDGLEAAVGNGRVRKATLMLYQIDSPKFEGAAIGLFRVKRPWVPDSGSWMSYDGQKDHDWAIPGASGEADIEPKEDSKVVLDRKTNQWRAWDVTKYVQDVLGGKAQNNGMLFKIVNGEPEYHVRLYPESDLDRGKDTNLRPKLVLEIGRDAD